MTMCGRSMVVRGAGSERHRPEFFGFELEALGAGTRVGVALAVLASVALSVVLVLLLAPGLWWLPTTYFWVAFPALGLLVSGLAVMGQQATDPERELLVALSRQGEMTAAGVATETSLSVEEADRRLAGLAEAGHLEIRVRGGGIFYALWEREKIEDGL